MRKPTENGLASHGHAALMQHGKGVARAVAQRHHHLVGAQLVRLPGGLVQHGEAAQLCALCAVFNQHVGDALLKADFAAQRDDLRAQVFHHLDQLEGADVRVRLHQNLGRRAGLDKLLHHLAAQMARVLDLAPQLAVRERAGAALAKLHVAFGVEHMLAPQAPGVLGALAHCFAALQHDRLEAHLRQHQRRKNAAGAKAHHHRAQRPSRPGPAPPAGKPCRVWARCAGCRVLLQQGRFLLGLGQRHIDDVDHQHLRLAGIKTAFENVPLEPDPRAGSASVVQDQRR